MSPLVIWPVVDGGDDEDVALSCCAKAAEPIVITEKISPTENAAITATCFRASIMLIS
jgi:hypothetical protein